MTKLASLRLEGSLEEDIRVTLAISIINPAKSALEDNRSNLEVVGTLPPQANLSTTIDRWQSSYRSLGITRLEAGTIVIDDSVPKRRSQCQEFYRELRSQFNTWLLSESFRPVRDKWLEQLMQGEVRVLVRTTSQSLLKLPWHLWDLIERNSQTEVALSTPDAEPISKEQTPTWRDRVKILTILGDSRGIDTKRDRQLLETLTDAVVDPLREPPRKEISDRLWDRDWDILFFAGHSRKEGDRGRIYINAADSLTITELRNGLSKAIGNGLQLAIFNSCDGMGLAFELQQLHIPQTIVMREPVPDKVAHAFLTYFLPAFAEGKSLYLAVREARLRLEGLEDEFPAASGLPMIFQNPAVEPPSWQALGRRATDKCPYRGLFAFREEDAEFFHGRESFTQILVEAIQRYAFVSVIGASGSGKSSVIFAGLVAELRQQKDWQIMAFRPGRRPLQAIATAWVKLRTPDLPPAKQLESILELAQNWGANETALQDAVEEAIWQAPQTKLLIVIDQFEELYTQCQDAKERQAFIDRLLEVTELPNVALVLTLRTDFLGQALAYPPLADVLQRGNRMLGAMSRAELQAAIVSPAALLGVTLEEGLTERTIEAATHSEGNLPLLEFALQELWEKRQGTVLTHAAYGEIGGLEAAVARHADRVYSKLNESEKERSRQIFLQLVRPGEGSVDTLRTATRAEIGDDNWELVTRLASERLVVTGQDPIGKTETVELVHEALISQWSRLRSWIDENRDFRLWQERLRAAMQQWEKSDRDRGALLQGKPLADAENWWQQRSPELAAEREFIEASAAGHQRQKRQKILMFGCISVVGLLLATFGGVAVWRTNAAKANAQLRELVATSQTLFEVYLQKKYDVDKTRSNIDPPTKQKMAEYKQDAIDSYQDALVAALKAGRELQQTTYPIDLTTRFQVLTTLNQAVYQGKFGTEIELVECWPFRGRVPIVTSVDLQTIACANFDGTVRIFDSLTGKKLNVFKGDANWVQVLRFSPDGKTIASGTIEGDVKLWNLATKKNIKTLKGHLSEITSLEFSPDGQMIATGSFDSTITIWNILTGQEIKTFDARSGALWRVHFSPDGRAIAFVGLKDNKLKVWDFQTDKAPIALPCKSESLCRATDDIVFGANNQTITYSGDSYSTTLWDIKTNREIKTIKWQIGEQPFFSPDGKMVASGVAGSGDNTVVLRDNSTGKILQTFRNKAGKLSPALLRWEHNRGTSSKVSRIGFSSNSKLIAVASSDRTMTLWDISNGAKLKTFEGLIEWTGNIAFSPNSKLIATAGMDADNRESEVKLWDIETGKLLKTLIQEPVLSDRGIGRDIYFTPDSKTIAVDSSDATVRLWDISTGQELNIPGLTNSTALNRPQLPMQGGKIIASKMPDGRLKRWDSSSGKELELLNWYKVLTSDVKFSDDRQTIAVINWDGKKQIRDIATGKELNSIRLDFPFASSIRFSNDGSTIAAATPQGVKVWNASTGKEISTLKTDTTRSNGWVIEDLSFSPDGKTIVTIDSINTSGDGGVGLQLTLDPKTKDLTVVSPTEGSPAGVAGIRSEDIIVKIDAQTTKGMSVNDAVKLIRGQIGSKVVLTVRRGSKLLTFPLTRDSIGLDGENEESKIIKLWNVQTGKNIETFKASLNSANDIDFSLDGRTIAFAKTDGSIELRDFSTGKLITTLGRHLKQVDRVGFSPDGKMLVSMTVLFSVDELKLWDLTTGQEIRTYKDAFGDNVESIPGSAGVLFSPDGKSIFLFSNTLSHMKFTRWNLDLEDLLKLGCDKVWGNPKAKDVCGSNS